MGFNSKAHCFSMVIAGERYLYSLLRKYSQEAGAQTKEDCSVAICNFHLLHSVLRQLGKPAMNESWLRNHPTAF